MKKANLILLLIPISIVALSLSVYYFVLFCLQKPTLIPGQIEKELIFSRIEFTQISNTNSTFYWNWKLLDNNTVVDIKPPQIGSELAILFSKKHSWGENYELHVSASLHKEDPTVTEKDLMFIVKYYIDDYNVLKKIVPMYSLTHTSIKIYDRDNETIIRGNNEVISYYHKTKLGDYKIYYDKNLSLTWEIHWIKSYSDMFIVYVALTFIFFFVFATIMIDRANNKKNSQDKLETT